MSSTQLYNESDMESYFLRSVNWLIPTLQGVYPAGRNTLSAHKRECFPPISDSSAPECKRILLHFARPTPPLKEVQGGRVECGFRQKKSLPLFCDLEVFD